jgi:hypothetical protein
VNDTLRREHGEGALEERGVEQVALDELEARVLQRAREVGPLDRRVIEVVEVVEAEHAVPRVEQAVGEVRADEAGGARQEDSHGGAHLRGSAREGQSPNSSIEPTILSV